MKTALCLSCLLLLCANAVAGNQSLPTRQSLARQWDMQSSRLAQDEGRVISSVGFQPRGWFPTAVPSTVLSALVKNGVYPDPRVGMNSYRSQSLTIPLKIDTAGKHELSIGNRKLQVTVVPTSKTVL